MKPKIQKFKKDYEAIKNDFPCNFNIPESPIKTLVYVGKSNKRLNLEHNQRYPLFKIDENGKYVILSEPGKLLIMDSKFFEDEPIKKFDK